MSNDIGQDELISVVVPVYNTENYLKRCLDSVLCQTYVNFELILIDDGSFDQSGTICDKYAVKDKRVRVIHQENRGLAYSRNLGIKLAKGGLLTFIDSDDWVDTRYLYELHRIMKDNAASIAGCSLLVTKCDDVGFQKLSSDLKTYNSQEALRAMLQLDGLATNACGLLYDLRLFEDVEYPCGCLYEDFATTYKLFHKSKKIVLTRSNLYFYFAREGSIENSKYTDKHFIEYKFASEVYKFITENYPQIEFAARDRLVCVCYHLILMMDTTQRKSKEAQELYSVIKKNRYSLITDKRSSNKVRFGCALSYFGMGFVEMVYKLFHIKGKTNL